MSKSRKKKKKVKAPPLILADKIAYAVIMVLAIVMVFLPFVFSV